MELLQKIPPSYDGTTSCFKYEELIEDWLDLTVLDTSKHGPALKNRRHGNVDRYKPLLNRDALKADDGVKYIRDKLRPHLVKGAYSVFLWRFYLFIRARRGHTEMVDWIRKFDLLLKRARDSWMDMLPLSSMTEQQRQAQCLADMTRLNAERRGRSEAALDPDLPANRDNCCATHLAAHDRPFPFSGNLATWMFNVGSDLNETQRERLASSHSLRNIIVTAYTLDTVPPVFFELFLKVAK